MNQQRRRHRPVPFLTTRFRCAALIVLALTGAAGGSPVLGHDLFTAYVQHRIRLTVGADYTDVTVELTFFEDTSEHEREHLDEDNDQRISSVEREAYVRRLAPEVEKLVRLKVGEDELPLRPLYAPRLDLLGNDGVGRGHHRLTLNFFGATPRDLKPGLELRIEDRLWPSARALGSLEVEGKDGVRLEAVPRGDPVFPPARHDEAREFRARCLTPPQPNHQPT